MRLTTDQNLLHTFHGTIKIASLASQKVFAAAGVLLGNKVCVYTGAAIFNNKKILYTMQTAACLFSLAELFPTETICIRAITLWYLCKQYKKIPVQGRGFS